MKSGFTYKTATACRQGLLLVSGLVLTLLLGFSWIGFPGFLTQWILAGANEGKYYVEAHDLRLDLRGGLKASDVSVYRKGVVGPPFLEARELKVLFRLLAKPRAGVSRVKALRVKGGVIRADGGPAFLPHEAGRVGEARRLFGSDQHDIRVMDLDILLRDFEVMGAYVDPLQARLHVGPDGVRLSDVSGFVGRDLQRGPVNGSMIWTQDRQTAGRLVTAFDPRALIPVCRLFCPDAAPILERFSFSANLPRLDLSFEADMGKTWSLWAKGRMQASHYAYRGAGVGFANVSAEYICGNGTNRLRLDPFLMVVGGRNAEGKSTFDFSAGTGDFEVNSAIDLATLLRIVGLKEQWLDTWRLEEGARVMARGRVDYKNPARSEIEASVEGAKIGFAQVAIADYGFRLTVSGQTNQFSDIRGKIGDGSFSGSVTLAPDAGGSNQNSRIRADLIHVDAEEILKILTPSLAWRTDGKVYGNIELTGGMTAPGSMALSGRGQVTLRNSHVFKLPLFAGMVTGLSRIIPELDFGKSLVDAHFSYEIRNGHVFIRDLQIDDGPVTMTATGSCGLDGSLDFMVQVHLIKKASFLSQAITGMFSTGKGFEFTVGGSLTSPIWTAVPRR